MRRPSCRRISSRFSPRVSILPPLIFVQLFPATSPMELAYGTLWSAWRVCAYFSASSSCQCLVTSVVPSTKVKLDPFDFSLSMAPKCSVRSVRPLFNRKVTAKFHEKAEITWRYVVGCVVVRLQTQELCVHAYDTQLEQARNQVTALSSEFTHLHLVTQKLRCSQLLS